MSYNLEKNRPVLTLTLYHERWSPWPSPLGNNLGSQKTMNQYYGWARTRRHLFLVFSETRSLPLESGNDPNGNDCKELN